MILKGISRFRPAGVVAISSVAAATIILGCQSDQILKTPSAPDVEVSSLDGAPLNAGLMHRLRSEQACGFLIHDPSGGMRALALRGKSLPFELPAITKNAATGRGNGRAVSMSVITPGMGDTVRVECWVPSTMTVTDLSALFAVPGRWEALYDRLKRARMVTMEELNRPRSREAQQLRSELLDPNPEPIRLYVPTTPNSANRSTSYYCISSASGPAMGRGGALLDLTSSCVCMTLGTTRICSLSLSSSPVFFSMYHITDYGDFFVTDKDVCRWDGCLNDGPSPEQNQQVALSVTASQTLTSTGEPVTFIATASIIGAGPQWNYQGESGTGYALCPTGVFTCTVSLPESGIMYVGGGFYTLSSVAMVVMANYGEIGTEPAVECAAVPPGESPGPDVFAPETVDESLLAWERFSGARRRGGPFVPELSSRENCPAFQSCVRDISADQSRQILQAAMQSGEWTYTQGGAQGGTNEPSKDHDATPKRGDCGDLVWYSLINGAGSGWSHPWSQYMTTSQWRNLSDADLEQRGVRRLLSGEQPRAGDVIVYGGHAGVYTFTDADGRPHGYANNGRPELLGQPRSYRDGATGDHTFFPQPGLTYYYFRPVLPCR